MRTFISIDLPESVKEQIKKIQENLPEFHGKLTELENLHLTLKFLGEISEEKIEKIKEKLGEINFDKFETEIDSIGVFDNRKSKTYSKKFIVWLHLINCDDLQDQIDEKLKDLFEKEKRFMSHLTIARVKKVRDRENFLKKLKEIKIPKMKFNVDNFKLKKSILTKQGPIYEGIESYNLI